MNTIIFTIRSSILLFLTFSGLSACTANQQAATKTPYSEISSATNSSVTGNDTPLPQYEKVSGDHTRWIGDKLKAGNYKHLIIDPVAMSPKPENLTADQQKRLDDLFTAFNEILLAELSSKVSIVNTPGVNVARLQPIFTSVSSSMQGMKVYEVVPLAALLGGIKAATGTRGKEVELWLEAELVDSETKESLARIVRKGTADQAERHEASVEDVRGVLQQWAKDGAASAAKLFD